MNIEQAHMEISKERFLELMANRPDADPKTVAVVAISQADDFAKFYSQYGYKPDKPESQSTIRRTPKTKGCKACFGSGGKPVDPCRVCGGSGKVPA